MSAVRGVSGTNAVHVDGMNGGTADTPGAAPAILPPPTSGDGASDAMSILYLVESKDRDLKLQGGKADVQSAQKSEHDALKALEKAINDANEAAQHHSFWDDFGSVFGKIAKVAAVVASVAAAFATAGAATPLAALAIAGAGLSVAGFVQGEFHVLEKLGVSPEAAGWIGTGLSLGGAAMSLGASAAASGASVAASGAAETGTQAGASASATTGATEAAETGARATTDVAATVRGGATVVAGGATVTSGIARIESGHFKEKQDHALADASMDDATWRMLQRRVVALLDDLRESDQSSGRTLDRIGKTMTAKAETVAMTVQWRA